MPLGESSVAMPGASGSGDPAKELPGGRAVSSMAIWLATASVVVASAGDEGTACAADVRLARIAMERTAVARWAKRLRIGFRMGHLGAALLS